MGRFGRGGQIERGGRGQILAAMPGAFRGFKPAGAALPALDLQVVADGDVVEPVGTVFGEPDLAVLGFQGRVGVAQILAAAIRAC